jgi:hypothetical protein
MHPASEHKANINRHEEIIGNYSNSRGLPCFTVDPVLKIPNMEKGW